MIYCRSLNRSSIFRSRSCSDAASVLQLAFLLGAIGFADLDPVLAGGAPPTRTPRSPRTLFTYEGAPNDSLGKGESRTLTAENGDFIARSADESRVEVEIRGKAREDSWYFRFRASGERFVPGVVYEFTDRGGGEAPAMELGRHRASCRRVEGRFVVSEIYVSSGIVYQLAVDFEVRCDYRPALFYGYIRIDNRLPPLPRSPTPVPPTPRRPNALFAFESDDYDYLGEGQTLVQTDTDGTFTVTHDSGVVLIDFQNAAIREIYWLLVFNAPRGSELLPGFYEVGGGSRKPWLGVVFEGRICRFMTGQFVVLEAVYGAGSEVERFAADFEVRCEAKDPLFHGYVRINSDFVPPAPRTPTPTPPADRFVLRIASPHRDPIGLGRHFSLTEATADAAAAMYFVGPQRHPHIDFQIFNEREYWQLNFGVPVCTEFAPGVYENAIGSRPSSGVRFGGNVGGQWRGCESDGRFVIREVHIGDALEVYRFVADFEQHCKPVLGPTDPLQGSIVYTSVRPTPTRAPPTPTPSDYSSMAAVYIDVDGFDGQCRPYYLTLAEGDFIAHYEAGHLTIVFDGNSFWTFDFAAAAGEDLAPGTYTQASRSTARRAKQAWFDVNGSVVNCDATLGQFTVLEAEFGEDGEVRRFAAEFQRHGSCLAGTVYGTIHYRSTLAAPTAAAVNPPTPTLAPICWGDCDDDGQVTVEELIQAVGLALGLYPRPLCPKLDANDDEIVSVGEIIQAVSSSLQGCN